MKQIILITILLTGLNAFADRGDHRKQRKVYKACENMTFLSEVEECKKLAGDLGPKQIKACSEFGSFSSDRIKCLNTVASSYKYIRPNKIRSCSQESFSSERIQCLTSRKRLRKIRECNVFTFISEKNLCKSLSSSLRRGVPYACSEFSAFTNQQMECLELSALNDLSQRDVNYCAKETFSSDKINCLKGR